MSRRVIISLASQSLLLSEADHVLLRAPVSTARNGPGEQMNSGCTPRGLHEVAKKIGAGCLPGAVFVGRKPTGERYSPELGRRHPGRDWILTRILWLAGREPGRNLGGEVDSRGRHIYIHGCPRAVVLGEPSSGGCIRMHDELLLALFDQVAEGTEVLITED